jgi:hypothetical protein
LRCVDLLIPCEEDPLHLLLSRVVGDWVGIIFNLSIGTLLVLLSLFIITYIICFVSLSYLNEGNFGAVTVN